MPKFQPAAAAIEEPQLPTTDDAIVSETTPKTITNWKVFNQAMVVPTQIVCQDYWPAQTADTSCHTKLRLLAPNIARHMDPAHESGGGFQFVLRQTDGKPWSGWTDLEALGAEIHDFRCDICNAEIQLTPRAILRHMRPHNGKTRKIVDTKTFNMTLRFSPPDYEVESEG